MTKADVLNYRWKKIEACFQDDAFEVIFEDKPFLQKMIFFGSYMKGTQRNDSDIDVICIVDPELFETCEVPEVFDTLLVCHGEVGDLLKKPIPLDMKLQERELDGGDQYGWSIHSHDALISHYEFGSGQIGEAVVLSRDKQIEFVTL